MGEICVLAKASKYQPTFQVLNCRKSFPAVSCKGTLEDLFTVFFKNRDNILEYLIKQMYTGPYFDAVFPVRSEDSGHGKQIFTGVVNMTSVYY